MKRLLAVFLAATPAICAATDTLDCSGQTYGIQFHVGSEGIADFTLFAGEDVVAAGTRADLAVQTLQWRGGENDASNLIHVQTTDGFTVPFKLGATGDEGHIVVGGVIAPIDCDWER